MTIKIGSFEGGGGLLTLAPDLTFPSTLNGVKGSVVVIGIDASSSLTTILSLTGKFAVDFLYLSRMVLENATIKLTVDGVVIWNDTFLLTNSELSLLGSNEATSRGVGNSSSILCDSTLLLELQMTTDTDIDFEYLVRPIL